MTTASQIISDALTEIGVLGAGQTASAEDAALCLRLLNRIVQRWSTRRLMLPELREISVPLTGASSYTIGPSGVVVAPRPIKLMSATTVDSQGVEYSCRIYTQEMWDAIALKTVDGGPAAVVWYESALTNGVVHVYPLAAGYTLKLQCLALLTTFIPATTLTLPEGYESALVLTLAMDAAASFGTTAKPDTRRNAMAALKAIKAANIEPLLLDVDAALVGVDSFEIERGF